MTDHRDLPDDPLETELRAWFKAAGMPVAPTTLRTFVNGLGADRRPMSPVHPGVLAWRGAPGSRVATIAAAIAVVLVAGGLLIVSGRHGPTPPATSPVTTPPLTASPGPSGPQPTATPSAPSPVDDGGTFGTSGLWATRGSRLYVSTDNGAAWLQRTLGPGVALDATSGDVLSGVFMLDASHAWSAHPGPGSTVPYRGQGPLFDHLHIVVSRTSDGGMTWQSATISGDWGGTQPVLAFADQQHGFLLFSGLRGGPASTVFASDDGGATWRRAGGADSLGSVFGASDVTTLWAGNEGDAGPVPRPILDVSRDGGRTWTDARLPGLIGDVYVNDTLVAPPVFVGEDGAVAVIAASADNPPDVRFYRTIDGGRSWLLAARTDLNQDGSVGVAVIDPTHFVVIDSQAGVVLSTSDAGVTWQRSPGSGVGAVARLRFWDPLNGAAIVQLANGPAPAAGLVRTTDGGRTWATVSLTALVTPSSTPSASPHTATAPAGATPPCMTSQLQITLINSSVAAGTVGGWLRFVNASTEPCQFGGWPTLVGVTAAGTATVARQTNAELIFPLITGVRTITMAPGDAAFAAFAGSDTPGASGTCPPSYRSLRVTPPGNTESVSLSAWIAYYNHDLPACAGIDVTMVVPASDVPYLEPSPTASTRS